MSQESPALASKAVDVPTVSATQISLDGTGKDPVWVKAAGVRGFRLDAGLPENASRSTRAQAVRAGQWLLIAVEAEEPEDIIAREATHGTDLWYDDSVAVELSEAHLQVFVNPLGSCWCSRDGKADYSLILNQQVRSAARIVDGKWRAEIAIDLSIVSKDGEAPRQMAANFLRERQQRGLTPFEASSLPTTFRFDAAAKTTAEVAVKVATTQRFVEPAQLDVARVAEIPASEEAWAKMPATALTDESGRPMSDPCYQRTEVRAALANGVLTLRAICFEKFPDSIDTDSGVWSGDELELFLGPEGYPFIQLACNAKDQLVAIRGRSGGKYPANIAVPEGIKADWSRSDQAWMVTFTLPFASLQRDISFPADLAYDKFPWRIQLVRNRPGRPALGQAAQYSQISVTRSHTAHCPLRFALLRVVEAAKDAVAAKAKTLDVPEPVLSQEQRAQVRAGFQLSDWLQARLMKMHQANEAEFNAIDSLDAWKRYAEKIRKNLISAQFYATNGALPERTPLNARTVFSHRGDGFRAEGVILESRPGLPVTATLYVPDEDPEPGVFRPAMLMIPAHHTPRNHADLQIQGMTMARKGCVALAIEPLGSGERSVTSLIEHRSYQCNVFGAQLCLTGEQLNAWMAWDISRCVDYLLQRGDVDKERIALMGGVAGGGDITAFAALVDPRITVNIPFTFNNPQPWDGYWDPTRTYVKSATGGYTPWHVMALFAPKQMIMAHEFHWTDDHQARFERFQKVYKWYGALDNLDYMYGEKGKDSTHFNHLNRIPVDKILNRWWQTDLPVDRSKEYTTLYKDTQLTCTECGEGMTYLNQLRADNRLREAHEIARSQAATRLAAARDNRAKTGQNLRDDLAKIVHDTDPVAQTKVEPRALADWHGWKVEGLWLNGEADGAIGLAAWLIKPKAESALPVVLGFAQYGKAQFLADRAAEVEKLLNAGVAVALLDVRGTGETALGTSRFAENTPVSWGIVAWLQDTSLPALQLKDVRTALRYLAGRSDLDSQRIALWGEGLSPANGGPEAKILFDESTFRQCSPTPKQMVEPLGGWLALAGALYPIEIGGGKSVRPRTVLARGTLVSNLSVLDRRWFYVPEDALVPDILTVADVVDVVSALRKDKVGVLVEDLRDGCNLGVDARRLVEEWREAAPADYRPVQSDQAVSALIAALQP